MKNRSVNNILGKTKLFIISFSLVAVCGFTLNANAKWTRTHASDCTTIGGTVQDINYSIHNRLESILSGEIDEIIQALRESEREEILKQAI